MKPSAHRGRPHLAVALLCATSIAGLLWIALAAVPSPAAATSSVVKAPPLFDQPFRGVPRSRD